MTALAIQMICASIILYVQSFKKKKKNFLYVQSTLRKPVIKNMRKALLLQYTIGLAFYYGVSIVGYWAYGSSVSVYLPNELSRPKWAKVLANATVFLQTIISQHVSHHFNTVIHIARYSFRRMLDLVTTGVHVSIKCRCSSHRYMRHSTPNS